MRRFTLLKFTIIFLCLVAGLYLIYADNQVKNSLGGFFGRSRTLMSLDLNGSYRVFAQFDNVGPLKVGDSIRLAGVEVGLVEKIELSSARSSAVVEMRIKKEQPLYSDDILSVATFMGTGEYYIKVQPGSDKDLIKEGSTLYDTESYVDSSALSGLFGYGCQGIEDRECFRRILACVEEVGKSIGAGVKR